MSQALHLNLLNPLERKSSSPIRGKFMLAFATGLVFSVILLWALVLAVLLTIASCRVSSVEADIRVRQHQSKENDALKAKLVNSQAEIDQFDYYVNGRRTRGNLLRLIALAVPEGVSLTLMEIPEPGDQHLQPRPGVKAAPLQGPTETTERVELRLAGFAKSEKDVFHFMDTLKGSAFTNDLLIAENPSNVEDKSPRVLAFRQEMAPSGERHGVFFDVIYLIKPREFAK